MKKLLSILILAAASAVFLVSCGTLRTDAPSKNTEPSLTWPPAPDAPRIRYEGSIYGPLDIGARPAFWKKLGNWITGNSGGNLRLAKPFAAALDETGNLCLTDTDANLVCYLDFAHKQWRRYSGAGGVKFVSPVAVARHAGIFYVADSSLGKVFAFKNDGALVAAIGDPLSRPVGLAVAGDALYVVDAQEHAILVFGLDGHFHFRFGHRGTGPGEFNFPTCAASDGRGHLLVSDTMNFRVQTFDLRGNFLSQFGGNGDTSGHFARPKGVAVDPAGHVYVVDGRFDNFQIFDSSGRLLLNVGSSGGAPGEFALPNGIAIGADNRIFVADAFNRRVQIFKYLDQP